jgi:hypothetical protein
MFRTVQAFVVTTSLSLGLAGCPSGVPDDSHNNDTEDIDTTETDTDSSATAFVTMYLEFQDGPVGEVQDEDCEFAGQAAERSPIIIPTGVEVEVPANVPIAVNIRGGKHRTDLNPGWVVMPTMTLNLAPGEHKVINVTGNPAWFQDNGSDWTIIDCRTYAVDDPNDSDRWYSFTTYNDGESVGVMNGYQLFMTVGHEIRIDFDGPNAVMIDEIDDFTIVDGTLVTSKRQYTFEMANMGDTNDMFACVFDN